MHKVKIRSLTVMAGPDFSVRPGEVVSFPEDEAERLVKSGQAEYTDDDTIHTGDLKTEHFEKKILKRK